MYSFFFTYHQIQDFNCLICYLTLVAMMFKPRTCQFASQNITLSNNFTNVFYTEVCHDKYIRDNCLCYRTLYSIVDCYTQSINFTKFISGPSDNVETYWIHFSGKYTDNFLKERNKDILC